MVVSYAKTPDRNVDASVNALSAWVNSPYRGGPAGCAAMLSLETRRPAPRSSFFFLIAGDMLVYWCVASRVKRIMISQTSFRRSDVNSGQTVEIKFGVPQVIASRTTPVPSPVKLERRATRDVIGQVKILSIPFPRAGLFSIYHIHRTQIPACIVHLDISISIVRSVLTLTKSAVYARRMPSLARDSVTEEVLTHHRYFRIQPSYNPHTNPKCLPQ